MLIMSFLFSYACQCALQLSSEIHLSQTQALKKIFPELQFSLRSQDGPEL